ncbi:hypothetical protein [Noviherbaspirillum malthae]|uniref:hypothetical protein n=1 Tax=Noviherbaspirillum malthae TaxID=1260987 RepID=UPI00189048C0|nr:hypothetical protein [Noviherbaspirillum malthae]
MNQPDRVEEHFKTDGLFIVALNIEIDRFVESGHFVVGDGVADNVPSLSKNYRADIVQTIQKNFDAIHQYTANFNLRAYLKALPEEVTSTLASVDEIPHDLILLKTKCLTLHHAKNTIRMIREGLALLDASVLEKAEEIQQSKLDAFIKKMLEEERSMDFAPFNLEQMKMFSTQLQAYYAKPEHWNERCNLDQLISGQLPAQRKHGTRDLSTVERIRLLFKNSRDGRNVIPAWDGKIPSALKELRDKYWAVAQTRHECEEASKRLNVLRSLPDGEKGVAPSTPVWMQSATRAFSGTSSARLSLRPTVRPDRKATSAIPLLDQYFSSNQWEGMEAEDPGIQNYSTSYQNTLAEDFDRISGAPTEAYVSAMTKNAQLAKQQLNPFGLTTGEASAAGMNCLIHSMLAGVGITDNDNISLAQKFRTLLVARLREKDERLGETEFLNSFGSHPANLIDLINEYFPDADVGVRIYTPLPGGGLLFNNPDSVGGTGGQSRKNTIAVMWVGNHYEPIQTIGSDAI